MLQKIDDSPAWQAHQELKEVRKYATVLFLEQGRLLTVIQSEKHYEMLGYETFTEYLGSPELSISERSAYRSMLAYRLKIEMGLDEGKMIDAGISKLQMIAPHLEKDNKYELLNMATTLSRGDLRIRLGQMFNGDGEPEWCQCAACGHRHLRRGDAHT